MDAADPDTVLRLAAFAHVRKLGTLHDALTSEHLTAGFTVDGERIPLVRSAPTRGKILRRSSPVSRPGGSRYGQTSRFRNGGYEREHGGGQGE